MVDQLMAQGGFCAPVSPNYEFFHPDVIPDNPKALAEFWLARSSVFRKAAKAVDWKFYPKGSVERQRAKRLRNTYRARAETFEVAAADLLLMARGGGIHGSILERFPIVAAPRYGVCFVTPDFQ